MHNRQKHGNLYHHHHYHNPHHLMDNKNPPGVTSSSSSMDSSASSTSSSSIYTIPGYIAYTLNQNQRGQGGGAMGMPPTSGPDTHLYSGVSLDNPAFHDVDHKCTPPPPPPPMFSALVRVPLPGIAKNFDIEDETKKPVPPPLALHPAVMAAVAAASPPSPQPTKAPHGFKTWKLRFSKSVKGDRRACAILCVLVSSILLLLGALAVVLYLTVGGGLRLFNKNSGESGEDGISRIQGSFRISNLEFSEDLTNSKSRLYNEIGDEVVAAVDSLFYRSGINDTYNRTELLGFRNGSLTVDVMIFLSSTLPKASETVSSVFIKGLVNMQGTVLLDKFVVDVQSVNFHDLSDKNETITSISTQRPEKGSNLRVTSPSVSSSTSKSPYSSTRSTVTPSTITIPSTSHKERQQEPQRRPSTTSTTPIPPSVTVTRAPASGGRGDNSVTSSAFMPPSGSRGRDSAPQPPPPPATINIVTYGTSPRADTLPTWAQWSPWTNCGADDEPCPSNQTQVRTRECRSRGGTGPALLGTDAEECEKRGGLRFEIRRCPCATQTPRPSTASMGSSSTTPMTTTLFPAKTSPNRPRAPSNFPIPGRTLQSSPSDSAKSYISPKPAPSGAGRPCDDCQEGEICLGKHAEREPTCRPLRDSADQTGCGGWCDLRYEYCQKLATGAFKCIDDRVCLPDEWQCGDGLCIPADKRCDGHFNCYDTTDELNCQCDENHFRCGKNTSCLPLHKRCDRIIDCWDGSDEENCTKRT